MEILMNLRDEKAWRPTKCRTEATTPYAKAEPVEKEKSAPDASAKTPMKANTGPQSYGREYEPALITVSDASTNWKSIEHHTTKTTLPLAILCGTD